MICKDFAVSRDKQHIALSLCLRALDQGEKLNRCRLRDLTRAIGGAYPSPRRHLVLLAFSLKSYHNAERQIRRQEMETVFNWA